MSVSGEATLLPRVAPRVTRSRRNVWWTGVAALVIVVVFYRLPYLVHPGTTAILGQAFIILTLASMWNLLAGYGGLVSVGQQAFFGLGAYAVLIAAMHGVEPFLSLPLAAIGAGVAALPLWWLVSRLRTGYFAIGTWVLATETRPPYPASRFHMQASVKMTNAWSRIAVVPGCTMYGSL